MAARAAPGAVHTAGSAGAAAWSATPPALRYRAAFADAPQLASAQPPSFGRADAAPGLPLAQPAARPTRLVFRATPPANPRQAEREAQVIEVERRVRVSLAADAARALAAAPIAGSQSLSALLSPAMIDELAQRVYAENRRRGAIERYRKGA
jgi:hypothetical protein